MMNLPAHFDPDHTDQWLYLSPLEWCPNIGPQLVADAEDQKHCREGGGFCALFIQIYSHLRLLEPTVPRDQVVKLLTDLGKKGLLQVVVRYATMMAIEFRKQTRARLSKRALRLYTSAVAESEARTIRETRAARDDPDQIQEIKEREMIHLKWLTQVYDEALAAAAAEEADLPKNLDHALNRAAATDQEESDLEEYGVFWRDPEPEEEKS